MKCPHCDSSIGQSVICAVRPLVVKFPIAFNARGQLVRVGEIDGEETVNIDRIAALTHEVFCPSCEKKIDPTALIHVPICAICGKERAQMTDTANNCFYRGLVCLDCATAHKRNCISCDYLKNCRLGARATSAETKPATAR